MSTTIAADVCLIVANILIVRFVAQGLGSDGFGIYSIGRRAVSTLFPVAALSMHIATTRYIAKRRVEHGDESRYLVLGVIVGVSLVVALAGGSSLFVESVEAAGEWVRGYAGTTDLVHASGLMLVGYTVAMLMLTYYRGIEAMGIYNLWRVAILGIAPALFCFFMADRLSASEIILGIGGLYLIAGPWLLRLCGSLWPKDFWTRESKAAASELVRYGAPRTPAGLSKQALLSIGPLMAPLLGSLESAGFFFIAAGMVKVFESGLGGFSIVSLPAVARLTGEGNERYIGARLADLVTMVFHLGLFVWIHLLLWLESIVVLWVGQEYRPAVPLIRLVLLGLIPYLAFVVLRSPIDAVDVRAINTRNSLAGLAVAALVILAGAFLGQGQAAVGMGMAAGLTTVGVLSVAYILGRYDNILRLRIGPVIVANVVLAVPAYFLSGWAVERLGEWAPIVWGLAAEVGLAVAYVALLTLMKVNWITEIRKRIRFE